MIELSVMDYFFVSYKPSEVALASLLNALDKLYPQGSAHAHVSFLSQFVDLQAPSIVACRERLALIYAQANDQGAGVGVDKDAPPSDQPSTLRRTTSPVSVMAAPQPSETTSYPTSSQQHQDMDYAIEEDEDYDYL